MTIVKVLKRAMGLCRLENSNIQRFVVVVVVVVAVFNVAKHIHVGRLFFILNPSIITIYLSLTQSHTHMI